MDLDILFLTNLIPKEKEKETKPLIVGNILEAANNLQWNLVEGLDINNKTPIKLINSMHFGLLSNKYKSHKINTYKFAHSKNIHEMDVNVGYYNIIIFKDILRYLSLKSYIKNWIYDNKNKKKVIIAYSMTITNIKLLVFAKKLNPCINTCLIVPDLPMYMNISKKNSYMYNIFKSYVIKFYNSKKKYIDSYVLLTKQMSQKLHINVPYVVVEGISSDNLESICYNNDKLNDYLILYTGSLNEEYGIMLLLNAFSKILMINCKLMICGAGNAEEEVIKYSKIDKRIIYKGQVDRKEILKLQKNATVLVNPRPNNEDFTKYSFPSKLLEYMSSGTPVVSYMLDGIPNEYKEYIYPIEGENTSDAIYEALVKVLSLSKEELFLKGKAAKDFVQENKNKKIQCEKILKMLNSL